VGWRPSRDILYQEQVAVGKIKEEQEEVVDWYTPASGGDAENATCGLLLLLLLLVNTLGG
jgi:hypothetical protein